MTDSAQKPLSTTSGGKAKATLGALYMVLCQHATPPLAGYLNMKFPWFGPDGSFETVVWLESALAAAIIKWTPNYFVDSITDLILFYRAAIKKWKAAAETE